MIKKILNVLIFLMSIIVPFSILIFVANVYRLDITPFLPISLLSILLLGLEIAMSLSGTIYMRRYLTKPKEKIFFIIAAIGFGILSTFLIKFVILLKDF